MFRELGPIISIFYTGRGSWSDTSYKNERGEEHMAVKDLETEIELIRQKKV